MKRIGNNARARHFHSARIECLEDRRVLAVLTPGNLLISTEPSLQPQVREYDMSGALVQQFNLPQGASSGEKIRDLVVDRDGNVQIFHGTFDPTQDELNPVTNGLSQISVGGWSTVNNVSYGGIATLQDYVFVTDMATSGDGSPKGILRIDTDNLAAVRLSDTVDFTDLTIGLDGLLYGLTSTRRVYSFDPISLTEFGYVTLGFADHRGIAVNDAGQIFTAAWDGTLYQYDSQGVEQNSLATGYNNLTDIDGHSDGTLVTSSRFGAVLLTDQTLASVNSSFSTGSDATFVAFTDGPSNHSPMTEDAAFSIPENSPVGSLVGQVAATDIDGDNLAFAIVTGNESGTFAIDAQGSITVADTSALDYELQAAYSLTVRVTDPGQLFEDATISIGVQDLNELAPTLTASTLAISEGQTVLIEAIALGATDGDSDDGSLVFVVSNVVSGEFLVAGVPAVSFDQNQVAAGLVSFIHDDGEQAPAFDVNATDGELMSPTVAATVNFTNVNDNAPLIPPGQVYSVAEDAANGEPVGIVSFSDSDLPGDSLTVSISGGDPDGVFAIDDVGLVTIFDNSTLDHESVTSYNLTVSVFDGLHTSDETVSIGVLDVNDVAPVMSANTIGILEGETLLIGSAHIAATDVDSPDGALIFSVSNLSGGEFLLAGLPGTSFSQSQITDGDVIFVHDGSESSPSFSISVSDGTFGTTPEATAIAFTNVNDQAPVISSGQVFAVSESASNGTLLGTVSFSDADLPGDSLTVSIASGDPQQTFTIDPAGNLTVLDNSELDHETVSAYALGIEVSDGVFTSLETVTVNVLDVLETKFFVPDNSADSTFEYAANGATVEDYSLASGNSTSRGATSDSTGSTVWVADRDNSVYIYDAGGNLQGSWNSADTSRPEGIATDDNGIWIVDSRTDRVYYYSGATAYLTGTHAADSSFSLVNSNRHPKGITTDGTHLWIVNDKKNTETVFKYTVAGALVGSWSLDSANTAPQGITVDPTNVNDVWIVDRDADQVFHYIDGANWQSGTHNADSTFDLDASNSDPRGIADPPPSSGLRQRQIVAGADAHFAAAVDRIWSKHRRSSRLTSHFFRSVDNRVAGPPVELSNGGMHRVTRAARTMRHSADDADLASADLDADVADDLL